MFSVYIPFFHSLDHDQNQNNFHRISWGIEEHVKIPDQGSIKKEVEFPGVFKRNSCESSACMHGMGPWFLIQCHNNFAEFSGVKPCFL